MTQIWFVFHRTRTDISSLKGFANKIKWCEYELVESIESPYSLFVYAIRSPVTKDCYQRRLHRFFDFIGLKPDKTIEKRINAFAEKANRDVNGRLIP